MNRDFNRSIGEEARVCVEPDEYSKMNSTTYKFVAHNFLKILPS